MSPRTVAQSREAGFTMVELLVYALLLSLVLAVVGGFLISTMTVQSDVRSRAEATTLGQSVVRSVQNGIRNASYVTLTDISGSQFLLVRTAASGANLEWVCQAWYYSPDEDGSLYMTRTQPAAAIAAPTAADLLTWTRMADGISADGETIFSAIAGRVTIDLDIVAADNSPISIETTAAMRLLPSTISPCEATP